MVVPPGGKFDFLESIAISAIREVKEKTGLAMHCLKLKMIYEDVNPKKNERYIFSTIGLAII